MSSSHLKVSKQATLAFVQVALPVPLHRVFEYSFDANNIQIFQTGCRVVVPFGKKNLVGIIMGTAPTTDYKAEKIKSIVKVIDKAPIFSTNMIKLATWIANFYIYPLGEVYASMLPVLLRKVSTEKPVVINDSVIEGEANSICEIETLKTTSAELPLLALLQAKKISKEDAIKLHKSKRQYTLFQALQTQPLLLKQAKAAFSPGIVKGLLDKNFAHIEQTVPKQGQWPRQIVLGDKKRANPEQAIAIASINQASEFTAFLLEGVTGSGKTEVYLQVIEDVLLQGKQVLILVPEIGLTPQTVRRFQQRFGDIVAVWHSALTDHERLQVWQQAKYNQIGIIIGTRSAVFLPLAKPGMIIVDEEHDESFKQQDTLRYHARDVAAYRAMQANISLVLGSATPSLESLHNALSHKFRHLTLKQRAGSASLPTQHLLDLTGVPLDAGIAPSMLVRIEQQLKQGNQVLIYVNRRGYAPALICKQCGHVESCVDCDNPFTVHLTTHNLQCHRCGQYQDYIHNCRQCRSSNITTQGVGTEQIQDMLAKRFADFSCVRIDSDSTRGKRKLNELLTAIGQNKHQLLVGTQILSKGHHFPNVTLAIILNVDSFLFSSDFRAPEKLAQLVTQFSGRAGRANKPGEVWLQSYQVGHPLLQDLVNNGYEQFSRLLLQERNSAKLPPLVWQVALRVEHADRALIIAFMQYANQLLGQFSQLTYVGPFPAGVEKKQTRFRFITVAQSSSHKYLNKAMTQVKQALGQHKLAAKMRWSLDVMPTDFS
jgi:primosomal protein N' (replication factor Y)